MSEKLSLCPYCKAEPFFIDNRFSNYGNYEYLYTIRCSKCGKVSVSSNLDKGMAYDWNRLVEYLTKMESEVIEND